MTDNEASTMNQIRQRMLLDLFITPWSLFPFIGGASLLMLAWATKVYGLFAFGGFFGLIIGVGVAFTNCLLNLDKFSVKALQQVKAAKMREREDRLNGLAQKLTVTREKKDDECLEALRKMYRDFLEDLEANKVDVSPEMIYNVEQIFEECIHSLEHSYELHETAGTMPKGQKQTIHDKRRSVLDEVEASVNLLSDMMVQIRTSNTKEKKVRLSKMREQLETQLRAAERTTDRMLELEHGTETDYSEYLEE